MKKHRFFDHRRCDTSNVSLYIRRGLCNEHRNRTRTTTRFERIVSILRAPVIASYRETTVTQRRCRPNTPQSLRIFNFSRARAANRTGSTDRRRFPFLAIRRLRNGTWPNTSRPEKVTECNETDDAYSGGARRRDKFSFRQSRVPPPPRERPVSSSHTRTYASQGDRGAADAYRVTVGRRRKKNGTLEQPGPSDDVPDRRFTTQLGFNSAYGTRGKKHARMARAQLGKYFDRFATALRNKARRSRVKRTWSCPASISSESELSL